MKKVILGAAIASLVSAGAVADSYQGEVGGSLTNSVFNQADSESEKSISGWGTFYLAPVDTSKGPLGEAAFLDRASGATIVIDQSDEDDADTAFGVSARYVWGQFIAEGSADFVGDVSTFGLGLGMYIAENTDLVFTWSNLADESDEAVENHDIDTYSLDLHSVVSLGDASLAYSLNGFSSQISQNPDNISGYGGDFTYYINNETGFGLSYMTTSFNGVSPAVPVIEQEGFAAHVEVFAMSNLAIRGEYAMVNIGDVQGRMLTIGASYRF